MASREFYHIDINSVIYNYPIGNDIIDNIKIDGKLATLIIDHDHMKIQMNDNHFKFKLDPLKKIIIDIYPNGKSTAWYSMLK